MKTPLSSPLILAPDLGPLARLVWKLEMSTSTSLELLPREPDDPPPEPDDGPEETDAFSRYRMKKEYTLREKKARSFLEMGYGARVSKKSEKNAQRMTSDGVIRYDRKGASPDSVTPHRRSP